MGYVITVNCGISAVTVRTSTDHVILVVVVAKMQSRSVLDRALFGGIIEISWVMSVRRLALSMLRVSVRGLSCRTAEARGVYTGAVLGQGQYWIVCFSWGEY